MNLLSEINHLKSKSVGLWSSELFYLLIWSTIQYGKRIQVDTGEHRPLGLRAHLCCLNPQFDQTVVQINYSQFKAPYLSEIYANLTNKQHLPKLIIT